MKSLVLIDSDSLSRALLSQCLAGQGWRVIEAEDGEAGWELVQRHRPEAVVCDLRTPKRNGFKVCRLIREQAPLKTTNVVLTGVSRFANDRETAFATGANDYLVKPIVPADLLASLARSEDESRKTPEQKPALTGPTRIRFWGVRGSIPTPGIQTAIFGGNTSCVEVRVGDRVIILDAGSGIRSLGQSLMREFRTSRSILRCWLHTPTGTTSRVFPSFFRRITRRSMSGSSAMKARSTGCVRRSSSKCRARFFPVGLDQMASHVTFEELSDMEFELDGIKVRTIFANHPGICLGYRLSTPSGDIVYMPDHEAYERAEIERQKLAGEHSQPGLDYARAQDEKVVDFIREADVVIGDTQYDATEYPSRLGWGHTCVDDAVDLALRAGVKKLFLFHHDPDHYDNKMTELTADAEEKVAAAGSSMRVSAAREGTEIVLE